MMGVSNFATTILIQCKIRHWYCCYQYLLLFVHKECVLLINMVGFSFTLPLSNTDFEMFQINIILKSIFFMRAWLRWNLETDFLPLDTLSFTIYGSSSLWPEILLLETQHSTYMLVAFVHKYLISRQGDANKRTWMYIHTHTMVFFQFMSIKFSHKAWVSPDYSWKHLFKVEWYLNLPFLIFKTKDLNHIKWKGCSCPDLSLTWQLKWYNAPTFS